MKILGMGNALVDVLAKIEDDEILKLLGLQKGGMTLIDEDKFHQLSSELNKMEKHVVAGGSASNTITGLAVLGVQTGFIGRIGKDKYGDFYKEDLKKNKVGLCLVETNETSGVASAFISKDGERTFGTFLGAAALLSEEDVKPEMFEGYDLFYIEGYLVQNYALIERAIRLAKEADLMVAIDLASFNIVEENLDFLSRIMSDYVDIVFANEEEAKAMTGLAPQEAVSKLQEIVELAIVKDGARGSWLQSKNHKIHIPASDVSRVDTTGAGDLYAAGFIYGLTQNRDLETCGKMGTLLAEEVIRHMGPRIPDERWDILKKEIGKL